MLAGCNRFALCWTAVELLGWQPTVCFGTCWPCDLTTQQQGPPLQPRRSHDLNQVINELSCLKDVIARRACWRSSIQVSTGPPPSRQIVKHAWGQFWSLVAAGQRISPSLTACHTSCTDIMWFERCSSILRVVLSLTVVAQQPSGTL